MELKISNPSSLNKYMADPLASMLIPGLRGRSGKRGGVIAPIYYFYYWGVTSNECSYESHYHASLLQFCVEQVMSWVSLR
jgi:hypothetical protein